MISRLKAFLAAGMLMLVAPVPAVQAEAQADARAALARAIKAMDSGDPRTARVELMNAIKADPTWAEARLAQARALLMLGNGVAAQDELDRAKMLGVPLGKMRHLRAHAALLTERYEDALAEAQADDADPSEKRFLAQLEGRALEKLERFTEARDAFNHARDMAPDDPRIWTDIARLNIASGDVATAIAATDRALELAPKSAEALMLRAMIVREQYGLDASRQWFDAALKADGTYVAALVEYAATLADLGRASEALGLTRKALALSPGNPRAFFVQALIAARSGNTTLARGLIGYMHGALGGVPAVRLLKAVLHMQAGNPTLAAQELKPLLEAQPLNIRARVLLARAYYQEGQYALSEQALFPVVERADADSYALTLAAYIHEALGNRDIANGFARRAAAMAPGPSEVFRGAGTPVEAMAGMRSDPESAGPNLRYVRALLESGDAKRALAQARSLYDANRGAPAAAILLGDCLMANGAYAEAGDLFEQGANMRFDEAALLRIADAWQRAGKPEKLQRALGLFLRENPMNIEAQRLLAAYMLAAGEHDRALVLLESMRARIGNEDVLLMTQLSYAQIGVGQPEKALPYAAHAYRLAPMNAVATDAFGWVLFKARGATPEALELLHKAAQLAPREAQVQRHLREALNAA